MLTSTQIMKNARKAGLVIPAFNVPYLPMVEPVVKAVIDTDSFAFIETARLEWYKFDARGPAEVAEEYRKWANSDHVRLHQDHVPVIDEDQVEVDYLGVIRKCIDVGFDSVMVDGSRLSLADNIAATRSVAELAHNAGIPCEAELGAVMGHESGPIPPYEELFASRRGFTDVDEARRFVQESGCDWLSVAVGNIHGAISGAARDSRKVEARLDVEQVARLAEATQVPLVLHGGSGVRREYVLEAFKVGIAKINVGAEIRQAYQSGLREGGTVEAAQQQCYERTTWLLRDFFNLAGDSRICRGA